MKQQKKSIVVVVVAGTLFICLMSWKLPTKIKHQMSIINSPDDDVDRPPMRKTSQSSQNFNSREFYLKEVEKIIEEQRFIIKSQMADYKYPSGQYGEGSDASQLSDLLMSLGGTPIRNLVSTTWRSGSTFLGDIMLSHPGTYYHYEPLLNYDIVQVRTGDKARNAVNQLKSLMRCDYKKLDHYLRYGRTHTYLFSHNTALWRQCYNHRHLCWLPIFLNPFCKEFPVQSIKTVRLRFNLTRELLEEEDLNLRVLLLVRDPRATMQSRRHREWCPKRPDCDDPRRLCQDLEDDYYSAVNLMKKFPGRIRVIRYEDLSLDVYNMTRSIFEFFRLDFHPRVQTFLDNHTKMNRGGVSSTFRDSKTAPFHWKNDLSFHEVDRIQRKCERAMELWGYEKAVDPKHLREIHPLKEFNDFPWNGYSQNQNLLS